jgi:hypothetical protein
VLWSELGATLRVRDHTLRALPCSALLPALKLPCLPACPTEGIATSYTTSSTGITFYLDTRTGFDWQGAKSQCNLRGGHIAMYSSWEEQREVEMYYQDNVRGLHGQCLVASCIMLAWHVWYGHVSG